MAFLKFLFVTILVIYFIRLVAPFIFRWIIKAFFKKMVKKSAAQGGFYQYGQQQQQQSRKTAGNVHIDYIPDDPDRKEFRGGKYVDYEEVK